MKAFIEALSPINALAERSPGFVWRLQTETGDATAIRAHDDPRMVVNLTVWTSEAALSDFVYRSAHAEVMRRRRTWFDTLEEAHVVLFWVQRGHRPSLREAEERLLVLRRDGPSAHAFTFQRPFPPPDAEHSDLRR